MPVTNVVVKKTGVPLLDIVIVITLTDACSVLLSQMCILEIMLRIETGVGRISICTTSN